MHLLNNSFPTAYFISVSLFSFMVADIIFDAAYVIQFVLDWYSFRLPGVTVVCLCFRGGIDRYELGAFIGSCMPPFSLEYFRLEILWCAL